MSYSVVGNKKIYSSIEDLPENQKLADGDRILIQTSDGTALVDYSNVKINLAHTTFEDTITELVNFSSSAEAFITEVEESYNTLSVDMANAKNKINEHEEKINALAHLIKLIMGIYYNKGEDYISNISNSALSGAGLTLYNEIYNATKEAYPDFEFGYNNLVRV